MKHYDWKSIAELVGIAAIVASLIFVGLQLKQSQEIAIAEQYQNRSDAALEYFTAMTQSDETIAFYANRMINYIESGAAEKSVVSIYEEEGAEQLAVRYLVFRSNITVFDNYHFQYEKGFMTDDAWQPFRERLKNHLSRSGNAAFYRGMRLGFRSSFREVCDEVLVENDADQ